MLPDTFGSKAFFEDFNTKFACLFQGTRQDSGDAFDYGEKAIKHYEHLRIEPPSKTIVFSNGLDIDESLRIHNHFHSRIKTSFGIGTDLTNSIGFKPLNMVIKLVEINGMPVVKLSDSPGKETGDPKAIEYTKWIFGIN
jgi:nicotinate phosphoribosyltransferase